MNDIVAVCVSSKPEIFKYRLPFVCIVDEDRNFPRGTVQRAKLVAELRNKAMKLTVEQYPNVKHILMIDSYYLEQLNAISILLKDYHYNDKILGSSTWMKIKTHVRHIIKPKIQFYDFGSTPEATMFRNDVTGIMKVKCVGACYIFPIEAWYKNGYHPREDYFEVEHKSLCKGYDCYIDFNSKLWREDMTTPFSTKVKFLLSHIGLGEAHYEA